MNIVKLYGYKPVMSLGMMLSVLWLSVLSVHALFFAPPKLVTMDLSGVVHRFIQAEQNRHIKGAELADNIRRFGHALDASMKQLAKQNHWVVVPKQAVIAGKMHDVTLMVLKAVQTRVPQFFETREETHNAA